MRIEVIGKHMELTPAIVQYAEQKCLKLPRYFDGVQLISVLIEQSRANHRDEFHVEIRVDVEKHDDFVVNNVAQDLYATIDLSVDKMSRQLAEFKERLKNSKR